MVFSERYFETRGPTAQRTTSKIITKVLYRKDTTNYNPDEVYSRDMKADAC